MRKKKGIGKKGEEKEKPFTVLFGNVILHITLPCGVG
jgi:hypothetical protein